MTGNRFKVVSLFFVILEIENGPKMFFIKFTVLLIFLKTEFLWEIPIQRTDQCNT